jgi:hypothetical protein
LPLYHKLAAALKRRGIETINCSPGTANDAFPTDDLNRVLPDPGLAAAQA